MAKSPKEIQNIVRNLGIDFFVNGAFQKKSSSVHERRVLLNFLISVNQHGFMKDRLTVTKLLEYASFVLNLIEEGWQVDSVCHGLFKCF
jgi:hypothetical protein